MQQIQLSIMPFIPVVHNQIFAFFGEKQNGFAPKYPDKLFESLNKTDSKQLLGFGMKSPCGMPVKGTYVKVGYNKYLLFNNTRYDERATLKPRDYHFPIKVSIKATKEELVQDVEVIRELIDQVYQFSRMYWKSISQQNLPVTTKYPEMVAEIFPHFEYNLLFEFGKENLWFL